MRVAMLASAMFLDYLADCTSRLPASDRRSSPRALCMLQPPLRAVDWEAAAVGLAGMGEPVDAPSFPRARRASQRPTCLVGQTRYIVAWLDACHNAGGRIQLCLDILGIGGRLPRIDPDLDIPLAEQRDLLHMWSRGDHWTHFQRLGTMPTTDPAEIRRAYLATCQRLHPDRYYGRRIGAFAGVLLDLFHRAHAAQTYLADPQRCATYLRQLAAAGHSIELADLADLADVVVRAPAQVTWTPPRLYIVPPPSR